MGALRTDFGVKWGSRPKLISKCVGIQFSDSSTSLLKRSLRLGEFLPGPTPEQRDTGDPPGFCFRKNPGGKVHKDPLVFTDPFRLQGTGGLFQGFRVKATEFMDGLAPFQRFKTPDFFGRGKGPRLRDFRKKVVEGTEA